MKSILLVLLRFYQRYVSPSFPPSCRFTPTCSQYTYDAIDRYGVLRGGWLGLKRVVRCNPWNPGGYDPVPTGTQMISGASQPASCYDDCCAGPSAAGRESV